MTDMKKLLFVGIDNAGKTSILHVLKKNYSFLNKLKPTKGIERSRSKILELDFVLWDLGGQQQYITEYFERKEHIFTDLSLLFFIIDLQDEMRFDNVLSYFEKIMEVMKEYQQNPKIVILFHKVDPDIEHTKNVKLFTKDLTKKIRSLADGYDVAFFHTSIFKRWSIIEAFSYGIRKLSEDRVNMLSDYLESWGEYFGANAILLMSSDDVVIGEFSIDELSVQYLSQYIDELRKIYSVSNKSVVLHMDEDLLTLNPLNVGKFTLYLLKYTNRPEVTEEHFTQQIPMVKQEELENILVNFFQKV